MDELQESRIRRSAGGCALHHPQRLAAGHHILRLGDDILAQHLLQHHVAPLQRQFRMFARIIHRGPLDHAHQHCDLLRLQPVQRPVEIEIAGQAKAVNRAVAILPEKNLVEIGLENLILAVVHLQQQRHQHLVRLARQRALRRQEEILDQLLGERAAALRCAGR